MKSKRIACLSAAMVVWFSTGFSQPLWADSSVGALQFNYWSYGASGNATVKGTSANLKDSNKVFSGDNYAFILAGERTLDSGGGLLMDLFWSNQSNSRQISNSQSVNWNSELAYLSAGGFLPILDQESEETDRSLKIDGLFGLRSYMNYYNLEVLPYNPANDPSREDYVNWVDTYLGLRLRSQLSERWAIAAYGDVGGFGIGYGSELSVLSYASLIWTVSPGFNLMGGYRLFNLETARDNGTSQTSLDLNMGGLMFGLEGRFF